METVYPKTDDIIINSVTLNGNDNVSMNEVLYLIRQRPPNWFFRRPDFDSRLIKLDALTLKSYYHSKGFLDVVIEESFTTENELADILYNIDEGKQYYLKNISVHGNQSISEGKIRNLLGVEKGRPYNPVFINDNLFAVENAYHELGKLFFTIKVLDEISDSVNVNIQIKEGKDIHIKNTYLEKIGSIDSSLIWRELTYTPGDIYSKQNMDNTSRRLREMGMFSMANMIPVKVSDSDSLVNMVIEFHRYKQREWNSVGGYDPIRFAEGAEPIPAISGTIEWRNRSFLNTPTQFSTKLLAGIPVEEEFVVPRLRFDMSFSSSWFIGIRLPTKLIGFYETFIEYDEKVKTIERYGINLSQLFRFDKRSYFESKSVWESFSDQSESDKNIEQRSIGFKVNIDKKDDPFFTRKGYSLTSVFKSAGYILGGEREYLKADFTVQTYRPIGEKSVFAIRIKLGRIWGWDSNFNDYSYEKFYLGGSTSMRGWDVLRFEETATNNPSGEIIRFMTNLEFRFPIYKTIGITLFSDGGLLTDHSENLSPNFIKWDSGIGIMIQTPLGPARLDYAIQVDNPRKSKIQLGVQNLF
ncbi:MAG: BamA/TamA family outer membrane protein [Candidatus Marinimicrobia bacterium]|jgi:outer membrane protein insertion porin family|nr:BamA/TamA family outer membrane protein [Candidatus Neomarinimicrobiota bacterium]